MVYRIIATKLRGRIIVDIDEQLFEKREWVLYTKRDREGENYGRQRERYKAGE